MFKEKIVGWLSTLPGGNYLTNDYVVSAMILVLAILISGVVMLIFTKYFERLSKKTKTKMDDLIVEKVKSPLFYFILVYGIKLAVINLGFNGIVTKLVDSLMALVFVLILVRLLDIFIDAWGMTFAKKTKTKIDDVLLPLFHKASRVVFIVISIMWVLHIWEIDITPYLAGAGIVGLVLGMALQDSLKNVFGGVTLILDKTYKVGDKVKLESGEVGTIHDIGLRSTKLVTYDNEIIYIPNGYLANSRVQNYTRPSPKIRVKVNFGVEYGSDVDKVKKVVLAAVKKMKGILFDPEPGVQFLEMGDFALKFNALFWVEDWSEAWGKKLEATQVVYETLGKAKIGIPFPTQTIKLEK
tara:strand:+ start:637 stop:1698 length:1062 start_codon:yes stop_codon:yes gene_type:complete